MAPHVREYERASPTATSAFVGPQLAHCPDRFGAHSAGSGFDGGICVMGSNGGVVSTGRTRRHPATTCLPCPAGGVFATPRLARGRGLASVISIDKGGTATDVCVITRGEAAISAAFEIAGLPITLAGSGDAAATRP